MRKHIPLIALLCLASPAAMAANGDWTGWHVGGHAGHASGDSRADVSLGGEWSIETQGLRDDVSSAWSTDLDPDGSAFGLLFGYDHQFASGFVLGAELDYASLDISDSRAPGLQPAPSVPTLSYDFANTIDLDDNGGNTPTVTLTSGRYYLAGYTGESADQLVEHITTQIVAEGGAFANVVCSYSASTGKVSFVAGAGANIDIAFTDTALRDLLGFAANITGLDDTAQTATNEARYVWRPDRALSGHPVGHGRVFRPESTTVVFRSKDGSINSVVGNTLYAGLLEYSMIAGARVYIPDGGSVNQELERFFEDVIANGEPIRFYPDRTVNTSTDYVTLVVGGGDGPIGAFDDFAQRHIASYSGLWDIGIPVIKNV